MSTAFTPGPWMSPDESYNDLTVWATKNGKTEMLATACPNQWCKADEAHANARLMAAAPELLEALQFCQSVIKSQGMFDRSEQLAYGKASSAIAKATGEKEQSK